MGNNQSFNKSKKEPDNSYVLGCINSGFGNQLFQIANAYAYAKRYGKILQLTKFWSGRSKQRPSYWDTYLNDPRIHSYLVSDKDNKYFQYPELNFSYKKIPPFSKNIKLLGYFQSEKYFDDCKDEIKDLFKLNPKLEEFANSEIQKLKGDSDLPLVMVHIRRGDYAKTKKHTIQPLSYYSEAQTKIEENLGFRPRYIYFTDDPLWVKVNFNLKDKDIVFSSKSLKDYEEFAVMQKCDHFIIANSTFSWWAAWLSKTHPDGVKKVYAPFQWFNYNFEGRSSWKDIYSESQGWEIIGRKESKNFMDIFFLGVITCEKYKHKIAEQNLMNMKLPFKFRYFIGDPSLSESEYREDKDSNIVYLPCPDNYESLPKKVYCMLEWITKNYPETEYICKMDDDVKINLYKFIIYSKFVATSKFDYAGVKTTSKAGKSNWHLGKTEDINLSNQYVDMPKCRYCGGPTYYLSRKAINVILEDFWKPETKVTMYEDQSVGHCLNRRGIEPSHITIRNNACYWP
jgi:hypothetical protein